ncbi:MAG: DUF3179 domain-containing protein [Acidobacteria bacterium]|nr:DUF3179 domain-containing protein [Acidobacteriota bacterium]MDA1237023.1 DUF3179 domain-containing protein [Acidobacteriota bacterium]
MLPRRVLAAFVLSCVFLLLTPDAAQPQATAPSEVEDFIQLLSAEGREESFRRIKNTWQDSYTPMLLDVVRFTRDTNFARRLLVLLGGKTGKSFQYDVHEWWRWHWSEERQLHPDYAECKAALHGLLDPKFQGYFSSNRTAKIRLDEVVWGGVVQDGIPPLRSPKMISADEASYLKDDNIVFGLEVNGDARAYPKRILAWHEMFVDVVGGVSVAGVYCTLCGSMVLYETVHDGVDYALGTSGFLYRSNKLMYDRETQSLWSTLRGEPVIGPLADKDITLTRGYVVTTTWAKWRERHPDTQVLSIETGYDRDYAEGVAYRSYFATDELMFAVPKLDRRLKNKAEVLALTFPERSQETLAISASFLKKNRVHADQVGEVQFVVLTDESGANRVYETQGQVFERWDSVQTAVDQRGVKWTLHEDRLESAAGDQLVRLPAHRAFWFGWYSAYPDTRLVR